MMYYDDLNICLVSTLCIDSKIFFTFPQRVILQSADISSQNQNETIPVNSKTQSLVCMAFTKILKFIFFTLPVLLNGQNKKCEGEIFFKPYELKKRDHYWQKINFKGWKKRKICSTHLMTSGGDPLLPLMMSKMQCTNFCLSFPHPLFLYKKSALVKKKNCKQWIIIIVVKKS